MSEHDYEIAVVAWLLSLLTMVLGPLSVAVILATTVNLYHQRRTMFDSGAPFERRVNEVLAERLARYEARMARVEAGVDDVKESQIRIAGITRGRQLPS